MLPNTSVTRCACVYERGEHEEGSGRCPYGPRAEYPHPDFLPRVSARANEWLEAILRFPDEERAAAAEIVDMTPRRRLSQVRSKDMHEAISIALAAQRREAARRGLRVYGVAR